MYKWQTLKKKKKKRTLEESATETHHSDLVTPDPVYLKP